MLKTNFDQSSCGMDIELSISRDTDRAGMDFSECFEIIQQGHFSRITIAEYIEFGNFKGGFFFSDPTEYQFTKKELIAALLKHAPIEDLNYDAKRWYNKTLKSMTKPELIEFAKEWNSDPFTFAEFMQENFTSLYTEYETRGYSQGDYAQVIFSNKFKQYWKKETNKDFTLSDFEGMIDNLFWNAPIYARIEIDGEEYYLDELLQDQYEYDKDKMIADFIRVYGEKFNADNLQIVVDFLTDNLPEYPDYQ